MDGDKLWKSGKSHHHFQLLPDTAQTILWNRFKSNIFELKFNIRWNVVVKPNVLGLFRIRNGRLIRFELMRYLID